MGTIAARADLLKRFAAAGDIVRQLAAEVPADRLDIGDGWSARGVFHHLADSELIGAVRLRRLISEDDPEIRVYDQDQLAAAGAYERPIQTSAATFSAVRALNAELLAALPASAWARRGRHAEFERYDVDQWLATYTAHAEEHVDQIRRAARSSR